MSLIPSESYSFPDNYSSVAARRSRILKDRDAVPCPVNRFVLPGPICVEEDVVPPITPTLDRNGIDTPPPSEAEQFLQAFGKIAEQNAAPMPAQREEDVLPLPQPMSLETNVMLPASQNGQEMFLQALGLMANPPAVQLPSVEIIPEPSRIPLAPRKVRPVTPPPAADDVSLSTANGHGRPRNLRPKTPVHALQQLAVAPVETFEPKIDDQIVENEPIEAPVHVPVTAEPFEQFDFDEAAAAPYLRQRRRKKFARFFLLEFMAMAVLVPSAGVVLSHDLTNATLVTLMNILTISAAVAVAIIPIMVFAIGPAFTRDRRM